MSDDSPVVEERELSPEEIELATKSFQEGCEFGYSQHAEDLAHAFFRMAKECQDPDAAEMLDKLADGVLNGDFIQDEDIDATDGDEPCDVKDLMPNLDLN